MVYTPIPAIVKPPIEGTDGSMRSSVIASTNQSAARQNEINRIGGRKRLKGGADIIVPAMRIPYQEQNAGNQSTSASITNSTILGAGLAANSEYDGLVGQKAGGWPHWGCLSGGKHRTKRSLKQSRRKSRSSRSSRRRRRRRNRK